MRGPHTSDWDLVDMLFSIYIYSNILMLHSIHKPSSHEYFQWKLTNQISFLVSIHSIHCVHFLQENGVKFQLHSVCLAALFASPIISWHTWEIPKWEMYSWCIVYRAFFVEEGLNMYDKLCSIFRAYSRFFWPFSVSIL